MPELPDVQVFRERLERCCLRRRIREARFSGAGRLLRGESQKKLRSRLVGHELRGTRRHGEHLFARLSGDGALHLHFGMTGEVVPLAEGEEPPGRTKLLLELAGGRRVAITSLRKLGLLEHRTKGGECPRCGGKLRRISAGGRSGWYCPRDQKARR